MTWTWVVCGVCVRVKQVCVYKRARNMYHGWTGSAKTDIIYTRLEEKKLVVCEISKRQPRPIELWRVPRTTLLIAWQWKLPGGGVVTCVDRNSNGCRQIVRKVEFPTFINELPFFWRTGVRRFSLLLLRVNKNRFIITFERVSVSREHKRFVMVVYKTRCILVKHKCLVRIGTYWFSVRASYKCIVHVDCVLFSARELPPTALGRSHKYWRTRFFLSFFFRLSFGRKRRAADVSSQFYIACDRRALSAIVFFINPIYRRKSIRAFGDVRYGDPVTGNHEPLSAARLIILYSNAGPFARDHRVVHLGEIELFSSISPRRFSVSTTRTGLINKSSDCFIGDVHGKRNWFFFPSSITWKCDESDSTIGLGVLKYAVAMLRIVFIVGCVSERPGEAA